MHEFDRATELVAVGSDRYRTDLSADWTVGDKPNGGYLLAVMARAASATLAEGEGQPDVLAAAATYARAPSVGPAAVQVAVLRHGRRISQLRATLTQDGGPCVTADFTFGHLGEGATARWVDTASAVGALALPPASECVRLPAATPGGVPVPLLSHTEVRLDPAVLGFAAGRPSGDAELRGWMRFGDDRPIDPVSLLYLIDALPPSTFELGSSGWVPTLQLTVYLRSRPAPGPVMVRQRARLVVDGMVDEVCDIWDQGGHLVAQGVQLALVRFGDDPDPVRSPPSVGPGRQ